VERSDDDWEQPGHRPPGQSAEHDDRGGGDRDAGPHHHDQRDSDPVGYAEAQIQPLRQIHAASPMLAQAITTLAGAYSSFYTANGTGPAKATLNTAIKRINSLCPDAGASA
jgi:hypothetical protein